MAASRTLRCDIITLFPDYFRSPFESGVVGRAIKNGLLQIKIIDLRQFGEGRYRQVDDRPYGGGPGMVLMGGPLLKALEQGQENGSPHVIYLSAQGTPLTARRCRQLSRSSHLLLICGRYEGIDERVIDMEVDEEISIGDYILPGGEAPATVLVEAVSRFLPGVVGNTASAGRDTFEGDGFAPPVYTRPVQLEGRRVPEVLLSGHHTQIEAWRARVAKEKQRRVRPDIG